MGVSTVTRVVGDAEGGGDGGNMARNNDDGLVLIVGRPDDDLRARSVRTMSATTERR